MDEGVQDQFGKELDQNDMKIRAKVTQERITPLVLKGARGVKVSQLTTVLPQMTSMTPTPVEMVVGAKLGGVAHLPCQCGRYNIGSNIPPMWKNSRGEELLLTGSEIDIVPLEQRKYFLYNDLKRLKVRGDCSLVVRNVTWTDLGEYTCTYLEPEFEYSLVYPYWKSGCIIRKVTLMIKDLSPFRAFTATTTAPKRPTEATTLRVNNVQVNFTTLVSRVSKSIPVSTQVTTLATSLKGVDVTSVMNTTSLTPRNVVKVSQTPEEKSLSLEGVVNVTQKPMMRIVKEDDVNSSVTTQKVDLGVDTEFLDLDMMPDDETDQYHVVQKRETTWKAFGFDSSVLNIADPWASRNLWFQQLTHSVRSVRKMNCPCVVKVPSPGTWPSILETIPEPLAIVCQSNALSWLLYQQQSSVDVIMALSVHLFKPGPSCSWLRDRPYMNLLDQHENVITAVPDAMIVKSVKAYDCFCANNTHNGPGMFMGISDCDKYMMYLGKGKRRNVDELHEVVFHLPGHKQSRTVMVQDQILPGNVTIGNFQDIWWVCGDKAYLFLPSGWIGCCYMATLKLPYEVLAVQKGTVPEEVQSNVVSNSRVKRELAQFHNLESYHWRISLGEKWGIGLFPWYGVTFLADHIDNITYTLQGFANETIRGFEYLSNAQRSHRLTLLKHDMALDYILAKQGGLCVALNLTGDACYTLIPDTSDNMTSVIDALKHIRDAFGASEGAGWSANAWLQERFGPMGAVLVQLLVAVLLSLCVMFCFCTLLLTFAKAMILRWVGVVMPGEQIQMPLLVGNDLDADDAEVVIEDELVETYPF